MARVLIVDDNSSVRRVISYTLRKNGYDVITAIDALDALERLRIPPLVELLILDVAMPKLDGLTLLKQLRADENYKSLPIIMLTASCDDHDQLEARAEGANEFLTKPASSHELLETVGRLLTFEANH